MDIKRLCLKGNLTKEIKEAVSRHLDKKYLSLAYDLKKRYLSEFNLKDVIISEKRADLFLIDENNFNFYYFSSNYDYLEVGAFSFEDKIGDKFEEFREEVRKIIASKTHANINFEGIEESPYFKYIKEEMTRFTPDSEQINIAGELKDESIRNIMDKIGEGAWLSELKIADEQLLKAMLKKLESYNLIKREYVVFCNETKAQIIRVADYKIIQESHKRGFKCFSCGRMLDEERIDHFITLTPDGKLFAKKNFWIFYIICAYLYNNIRKDLKIFYKEEPEAGALDLIINYQSKLILLQIKQDKINLADIYYFISKKHFYNVDFGCIFSVEKPDSTVEYFLNNKNSENIELYTKLDDFFADIPKILDKACGKNIVDLINIFADNTKINIADYLQECLKEASLKEKKIKLKIPEQAGPLLPEVKEEEKVKEKPKKVKASPAYRMEQGAKRLENDYTRADEVIKNIVSDINKNGMLTIEDKVEKSLKQASSGLFSCALLDEASGYYIYDFLDANQEKEREFAPYFAEIFSKAKDIAAKLSLPIPDKLYFDIGSETISLYNAGEQIVLMFGKDSSKFIQNEEDIKLFFEEEKIKCLFSVNTAGELAITKSEEGINCQAVKDYIFNLYNTAAAFFRTAGIEKIEKIIVENKEFCIITTFDREKIDFIAGIK